MRWLLSAVAAALVGEIAEGYSLWKDGLRLRVHDAEVSRSGVDLKVTVEAKGPREGARRPSGCSFTTRGGAT